MRYPQLDAVRGLAALAVVLGHVLYAGLGSGDSGTARAAEAIYNSTHETPLHVLYAGNEAVLIFFVLSGFVLHLMVARMQDSRRWDYLKYAAKRVVRLWPAYAAAVLMSALLSTLTSATPIHQSGEWIRTFWREPVTISILAQHLGMVGVFDTDALDFSIWSLVHEMRISLLFPLIYWTVTRLPALVNLGLYGALSAAVATVFLDRSGAPNLSDLLLTLHYLLPFALGALIAQHREQATRWLEDNRPVWWSMLALALVSIAYGGGLLSAEHTNVVTRDYWVLPGAALLVMLVLASLTAERMLSARPLQFLGRISYSLYLIHPVVLLGLLNLAQPALPQSVVLLLVPVASVLAAWGLYVLLELPSIQVAGRIGGARVEAGLPVSAP
ncbi:acyltransferase [Deinococcus sp. HMF7604]|uniref:acyltransferase family protein n=1 Tax=Deinococcus betulae TaxID=2873312 RepID=UPI001CCB1EA0|nr:acyltransferase [Deinococcus betulae]MBZ9753517.1 acyltransferase [Deinococcus betulae]